jgi:hypothetical protein
MADEELIFRALRRRMEDVTWTRLDENDEPVGDPQSFVTMSRRIKMFNELPPESQPACFQVEHEDMEAQKTGMPYKTVLLANWVIFQCRAQNDAEPTIENNLIKAAVRKALQPKPADIGFHEKRNTLNGLVHHCFIEGRVFKDPGDIDGQGILIIPIKLLVP